MGIRPAAATWIIILSAVLLSSCSGNPGSGSGKKVYADYHGVRYTREHDGKLGRWEMHADTRQSATGRKTLCYNADLVDSTGRHQIAAQAYPQVGMQSNLDEDYIEYQILSAKSAGIDGFFIEWGYSPHENDVLLKAMQKVASKYGFEIGVNWCDGWLYYDWITKIYPEIDTREEKTAYMADCWQYLIDSVFSVATAPLVDGHPVFYHFGAGATPEEFRSVLEKGVVPEGMKAPVGLHRWADWGRLEDGMYVPVTRSDEMEAWKQLGETPTAWLPARIRPMDEAHPYWDNYAEEQDLIEFMKPFRDSIWLSPDPVYKVKSGFVMPGMDNRGCAGWGRGHFFYIPRNDGRTYEDMWRFCLESRDSLDMIFIASWSDYTEGHEIEPTEENGDRELRTTLEYASEFKGIVADDRGLALPLELFRLRKSAAFLEACCDAPAYVCENAGISGFRSEIDRTSALLDKTGAAIASGKYGKAGRLLDRAEGILDGLDSKVRRRTFVYDGLHHPVDLPERMRKELASHHYTGYLSFEYMDEGRDYLFVRSSTDKSPAGLFSTVARIRTDGTGVWKPAKVELYGENIALRDGIPVFYFSGDVEVRNIALEYTVYYLDSGDKGSVERKGDVSTFASGGIRYTVSFHSESIVHIQALPEGDTLVTRRLVTDVETYGRYSCRETADRIVFGTSDIEAVFDKASAAFIFRDAGTGEVLLSESDRYLVPSEAGGEDCLEVKQSFRSAGDEGLYGLGQYQNGIMDFRGSSVRLVHSNMDIANPFLVSTKGYGILWDNYSATVFDDRDGEYSFTSESGDASDYYFIYGGDMNGAVTGYRELTGKVPMFGKWAFGFWQSKERYKSFDELFSVVREYRLRRIPLDNIVQDWEYWGDKPHWNALEFNPEHFHDPEAAIDSLHSLYNVHFMLSVWPGFGPETEVFHSLDSAGALFDERTWAGYKVFDVYNPEARDIFWRYFKSGLFDKGVDAWWMDATEPSFRDGFTREKQEERTKSAGMTHIGSFHRYLNTYSLEMMKDLYPRLLSAAPDRRPFIFTRSAFASQQKYGTAVWSGDVTGTWENLRRQIAAGLNLSVSGIPYWTSDTGGFYVSGRDGIYPDGLEDGEYKELYLRWFQFSAFTPVFRVHGTDIPREVWQFGEPGSVYYDSQVEYIRLRYRLLPYIYSVSRMVSEDGYSMMRPLVMDFTSDRNVRRVADSYMFGPSFLVRPVLEPVSENPEVSVYLPGTGLWYDYHTGRICHGGSTDVRPSVLRELPLYVKAGSIIPLAEVKQWSSEYPDTSLEVRVYAGADASFLWYDDEGDSWRFEDGAFSKVELSWDDSRRTFTAGERLGRYDGMPETVSLKVKVWLPSGEVMTQDMEYAGRKEVLRFR